MLEVSKFTIARQFDHTYLQYFYKLLILKKTCLASFGITEYSNRYLSSGYQHSRLLDLILFQSTEENWNSDLCFFPIITFLRYRAHGISQNRQLFTYLFMNFCYLQKPSDQHSIEESLGLIPLWSMVVLLFMECLFSS